MKNNNNVDKKNFSDEIDMPTQIGMAGLIYKRLCRQKNEDAKKELVIGMQKAVGKEIRDEVARSIKKNCSRAFTFLCFFLMSGIIMFCLRVWIGGFTEWLSIIMFALAMGIDIYFVHKEWLYLSDGKYVLKFLAALDKNTKQKNGEDEI